jgi:hypothetical protein
MCRNLCNDYHCTSPNHYPDPNIHNNRSAYSPETLILFMSLTYFPDTATVTAAATTTITIDATSTLPYCAGPSQFYLQFNTTNQDIANQYVSVGWSEEATPVSNISDANIFSLNIHAELTTPYPWFSPPTINIPYSSDTCVLGHRVYFLPQDYNTGDTDCSNSGSGVLSKIFCDINPGPLETLTCVMYSATGEWDTILQWCDGT